MTGYKMLMAAGIQFDAMVNELTDWIFDNEAELTEHGECADLLNDAFRGKLREACDGDRDLMESVLGEVAVKVDQCGEYDCTREWAARWA